MHYVKIVAILSRKRYKTRISVSLNILCQIAQIVTTAEIMVYMTRTHGFYSIYTNIQ